MVWLNWNSAILWCFIVIGFAVSDTAELEFDFHVIDFKNFSSCDGLEKNGKVNNFVVAAAATVSEFKTNLHWLLILFSFFFGFLF